MRHIVVLAMITMAVVTSGVAAAGLVLVGDPDVVPGCVLSSEHARVIGRDSFLFARDGSVLGAVPTTHNREPVPLARMSPWLPRATVAIEDRRFWSHGALDYEGIARAAWADLKAGRVVQGGSTIAQQFTRDRYLANAPMTLRRKLKEACLAVQLARVWSKRRILQGYLNLVFYGHHAYGVEAAARTYFATTARGVTLSQAALLAGLPQAPSVYDPFKHPRAAVARRDEVLTAMRSSGMISASRYRAAVATGLELHAGRRYSLTHARTYFRYALRELTSRVGARRARHGGLLVRTAVDPRLQGLAQRAVRGWLRHRDDPAAALVAIDPRSGAIRAMTATAPGRPQLDFDLASQSHRQAGSSFKVFTLTAAVEQGISLNSVWHGPRSLTINSRRCLNATGAWQVHNYADESAGTMTLAQAIAHSVNTIFAQVVMRVGPPRVVEVAHRMGIVSPLKPVCSITLGPEGVSPLEMTRAFATLAAHGVRHRAQALRRVTAADGEVLAELHRGGMRALSPRVAARVTSALRGVVLAGTGRAADIGRPVAGKTGTAENFKDAWFCGYVPQLAACAWMGRPQAEIPMHDVEGFAEVVGGSVPARIWHDFMARALHGTEVVPLPPPVVAGQRAVRAPSGGLLAPARPDSRVRPPLSGLHGR
jgi:penicillin-binding protein 1A